MQRVVPFFCFAGFGVTYWQYKEIGRCLLSLRTAPVLVSVQTVVGHHIHMIGILLAALLTMQKLPLVWELTPRPHRLGTGLGAVFLTSLRQKSSRVEYEEETC